MGSSSSRVTSTGTPLVPSTAPPPCLLSHNQALHLTELGSLSSDERSPSTGTDSGAYNIITGALPPVAINQTFVDRYPIPRNVLPNFTAIDLRTRVSRFAASGNFATYTGFVAPQDASQYTHIDFVFGGSNGGWYVDFSLVLSRPCFFLSCSVVVSRQYGCVLLLFYRSGILLGLFVRLV